MEIFAHLNNTNLLKLVRRDGDLIWMLHPASAKIGPVYILTRENADLTFFGGILFREEDLNCPIKMGVIG